MYLNTFQHCNMVTLKTATSASTSFQQQNATFISVGNSRSASNAALCSTSTQSRFGASGARPAVAREEEVAHRRGG